MAAAALDSTREEVRVYDLTLARLFQALKIKDPHQLGSGGTVPQFLEDLKTKLNLQNIWAQVTAFLEKTQGGCTLRLSFIQELKDYPITELNIPGLLPLKDSVVIGDVAY